MRDRLTSILEVEIPIFQAGMGGIAGPRLAAAVSNAGAAGCVGGYKFGGPDLVALLHETCSLTNRSVGVNFIPEIVSRRKLHEQISITLSETPRRVFITLFGVPDSRIVSLLRGCGRPVIVQVGSVTDVSQAAQFCDVVVIQGTEAGGHLLGELTLSDFFDSCRELGLNVPLVVSGGIADVETIRTYCRRGAAGVQLGSAFLVAHEADTHPNFVGRVTAANADDTLVTDRFSIGWPGRRHRVLASPVVTGPMRKSTFIAKTTVGGRQHPIPRYSATVPTRFTTGRIDEMAMYCGRSCEHITETATAAELVAKFATAFEGSTRT